MGKHGSLVDTIMIAHFNHTRRDITLISIPRDLFFNGRKINAIYSLYGMEQFVRQVSDLTGIELNRYVLIDMYAFIEVIDLLGGIDVTLEQEVIDPSYKTFDNGKWGTLYYKKGTHHLNGRQVLRLARSRHYSSDFARAERQQNVLLALKERAQNFGFGDADTILKIIKTVIDKTETNISIQEALTYYFRYQHFQFNKGEVLSPANILESTYEGLMNKKLKSKERKIIKKNCEEFIGEQEECEEEKGAYVLIPRAGRWKLIQWYINKLISN